MNKKFCEIGKVGMVGLLIQYDSKESKTRVMGTYLTDDMSSTHTVFKDMVDENSISEVVDELYAKFKEDMKKADENDKENR